MFPSFICNECVRSDIIYNGGSELCHPCKAMESLPELSSQRTALFTRRDPSTPTKKTAITPSHGSVH